jgi:hypothetical protein
VIDTLIKNWLLLGIVHSWNGTYVLLGRLLALSAGGCTIEAGLWRSTKGKGWLLVLNGLALGALGLIYYAFVRFGLAFVLSRC